MEELQFQVLVLDPGIPFPEGAVCFGDSAGNQGFYFRAEVGGLRAFYEDLIMGRAFPLVFATKGIPNLQTVLAICLFLHRDLAIHPTTPNLVVASELADVYENAGLAHIDYDLGRLFRFTKRFLPPDLSKKELESRLVSVVSWIRQYVLEDWLPAMPGDPPSPRILDRGTNGFVVAEAPVKSRLDEVWVELYRQGFLRGVVFGAAQDDRRKVLIARKSAYVSLDLVRAADIFNEAERAMGELPGWKASELWLAGPEDGTLLLPTMLLDVLVRV